MSSTSTNSVDRHAGFAAQAVAYVVGLGLFPMYLDGKQPSCLSVGVAGRKAGVLQALD